MIKTQYLIEPQEIERGSSVFREREKRDAMYKVATFLVENFWGRPREMTDALGVLLLTWNNALYRYGEFDFQELEKTLSRRMSVLEAFRDRAILSFSEADAETVKALLNDFLNTLKIADGKSNGRKSPVAAAKALHLLAPAFFPLWDKKIAMAYHCDYSINPSEKYLEFLLISMTQAEKLSGKIQTCPGRSLLKIIDEYNYARFTKGWI